MLGAFQVEFEQGEPILLATGPAWKSCANERPGWTQRDVDEADWKSVKVIGKYGIGPWGDFHGTGGRRLTVSPITSDPFWGRAELPVDVNLKTHRVYLEMDDLPDTAAAIRVNGNFAGGCIGAPLRVNITDLIKSGSNTIEIQPLAPKSARLRVVPGP